MCDFIKAILVLLLAAAMLSACVGGTDCTPGDTVNREQLEEAAKQNKLDEVWGKPKESVKTKDGRIDVYSFMSDGGCVSFGLIWGLPLLYPSDLPSTGYFTTEYDSNGSFKSIRVWHNADSSGEAAERHLQSLVNEKARAEARAEETRRLEEICEVPFAEAEKLGDEDQEDRFLRCSRHSEINRQSTAMWACLVANRGHPAGQNYMGRYFEDRHQASGLTSELIEAYKWYSLAFEQRVGSDYHRRRVESQLTPTELSKAKQTVIDWQPSPSECKSNSVMESSSARLN
jgi:TPR repeat protein